jgi:hypothetical protein
VGRTDARISGGEAAALQGFSSRQAASADSCLAKKGTVVR